MRADACTLGGLLRSAGRRTAGTSRRVKTRPSQTSDKAEYREAREN
jgi:hypothetical protein